MSAADDIRKILIQALINLGLLAKLEPGNIIEIDSHGEWVISTSTPVISGLTSFTRKFVALTIDWQAADRRRDLFFEAAQKLLEFIIAICNSLQQWALVEASSNKHGGGLSKKKISQLTTADQKEISTIIHLLQNVVTACLNANRGLNIMQSAPPYNNDPSYWEKVKQRIDVPMCAFLQNIWCCLGDFQSEVFVGITRKEDIVPRDAKAVIAATHFRTAAPTVFPQGASITLGGKAGTAPSDDAILKSSSSAAAAAVAAVESSIPPLSLSLPITPLHLQSLQTTIIPQRNEIIPLRNDDVKEAIAPTIHETAMDHKAIVAAAAAGAAEVATGAAAAAAESEVAIPPKPKNKRKSKANQVVHDVNESKDT